MNCAKFYLFSHEFSEDLKCKHCNFNVFYETECEESSNNNDNDNNNNNNKNLFNLFQALVHSYEYCLVRGIASFALQKCIIT